jgi:Rieske Fe-S protein
MKRKTFLKKSVCTVATLAAAPLVSLLEGCAPTALAVRASLTGNRVVLPVTSLPDLDEPNSYVKVYAAEFPNPFLVFRKADGELLAVLSTCAHRGCEVRKLRTKFECPCHGSEYDLCGNVIKGPASEPLDTYDVRQIDGQLEFVLE